MTAAPTPDQQGASEPACLASVTGLRRAGRALTGGSATAVRAVQAITSPTVLAGVLTEMVAVSTHMAMYPLGLVKVRSRTARTRYRTDQLSPVQRGLVVTNVEAAGTPILLVHGMIDNHSVFALLRSRLVRRGFGAIATVNYDVWPSDVRLVAQLIAQEVEAICAETGYERIHIVGHSLGGLAARYYVTRLGGDERVHTLVTLGTPHQGTRVAHLWPSTITRQLRPGSPLMAELAEPVPDCRTRFVVYWSDLDEVVYPQRNAALRHPDLDVRNVRLHAVGHVSLPMLGTVTNGISVALAQLDPDGRTVAAGATLLGQRHRQN